MPVRGQDQAVVKPSEGPSTMVVGNARLITQISHGCFNLAIGDINMERMAAVIKLLPNGVEHDFGTFFLTYHNKNLVLF